MWRHLRIGATIGLLLVSSIPLLARGIGHTFFMQGEIIRMDEGGMVACLGKADGAQVGQILEVYHASGRHRHMAGHVQADQIFDDHFAHFQVTDGTPQKGDWIRLKRTRS